MTTPEGPAARGARPSTEAELKLLHELETARARLVEVERELRERDATHVMCNKVLREEVPTLRARAVEADKDYAEMRRFQKLYIDADRARIAAEARLSEVEGALRTAVERCIAWMQGAPEAAPLRGIRDLLIAEARAALAALSGSPPISDPDSSQKGEPR